MIGAQELVNYISGKEEKKIFKLGVVLELFPSGKGKIQFDGEDVASGKEYSSLDYTAIVGDRVLLAMVGGTYIILGRVT